MRIIIGFAELALLPRLLELPVHDPITLTHKNRPVALIANTEHHPSQTSEAPVFKLWEISNNRMALRKALQAHTTAFISYTVDGASRLVTVTPIVVSPAKMQRQVGMYEAKTQLSRYAHDAAEGHDTIITLNGTPLARITAASPPIDDPIGT